MYPHERSLVEKYQGRPFALLGVNSDTDRERIRQAIAKEGINWRSWWAGSVDGPIPQLYRVKAWPTIYVLDARGVIRYVQVHGQALDDAIERLVREAESGRSRLSDP